MTDRIYPKATSPVTPQVLQAANDRAERWRVRCMEARAELEALKDQLVAKMQDRRAAKVMDQ